MSPKKTPSASLSQAALGTLGGHLGENVIQKVFQKDIKILNAEVEGLKQFVEVKNRRINKLEQVIEEHNTSWFTPVVAIASFALGVATTIGITYAVNK